MNRVLLTGRLTRDPEMRTLASGKVVTQFNLATNDYRPKGGERSEFHSIVTWDRLAEIVEADADACATPRRHRLRPRMAVAVR